MPPRIGLSNCTARRGKSRSEARGAFTCFPSAVDRSILHRFILFTETCHREPPTRRLLPRPALLSQAQIFSLSPERWRPRFRKPSRHRSSPPPPFLTAASAVPHRRRRSSPPPPSFLWFRPPPELPFPAPVGRRQQEVVEPPPHPESSARAARAPHLLLRPQRLGINLRLHLPPAAR